MRVLFVTNRYPIERTPEDSPCIAEQLESLRLLGHEVDLLYVDSRRNVLSYPLAMLKVLGRSLLGRKHDVIHAHYGYCGIVARAQFRCPVVLTFRGSDLLVKRHRRWSVAVARHVDAIIVMSNEMKKFVRHNRTFVLPYGIDLDLFRPTSQAEARRTLGLPVNAPLVLFPYDPRRKLKRFDVVEGAVTALRNEYPDIEVVAVHDKPHREVATYMNACDVMVLASNIEGAPVAVREAMACNLPVVSVNVGDVVEVIGSIDGCHICQRTPEDMADKLRLVLRNHKRTEGRRAIEPFSVASTAAKLAAIYENVQRVPGVRESLPG